MTADTGYARVVLTASFAIFLVTIGFLVAPSFVTPDVPTFTPTPRVAGHSEARLASDTVTIDAGDEKRWRFFDFDRGGVVAPPDTAGWDLAFRRFHLIPSGVIADLGAVPFSEVTRAPDSGYVASTFGRDTTNTATARWYTYSYFSHLLSPKRGVYVLQTREGRYIKLQILSYYCPGPTPGCVTFQYAYVAG